MLTYLAHHIPSPWTIESCHYNEMWHNSTGYDYIMSTCVPRFKALIFGITNLTQPDVTMKTQEDGLFYLPTGGMTRLKVELWYQGDMCVADQYDNNHPARYCKYCQTVGGGTTATVYPSEQTGMGDIAFLLDPNVFGKDENSSTWMYMSDIVPNRQCDMGDINAWTNYFGNETTYNYGSFTDLHVSFKNPNGQEISCPELDKEGCVDVPANTATLIVEQDFTTFKVAVQAMVLFYKN